MGRGGTRGSGTGDVEIATIKRVARIMPTQDANCIGVAAFGRSWPPRMPIIRWTRLPQPYAAPDQADLGINQLWVADITYIRAEGRVRLSGYVSQMDAYSRKVHWAGRWRERWPPACRWRH